MKQKLRINNDQATKEMLEKEEYKYGFVTDVEQDILPKGLDEGVIKYISEKKKEPEWLFEFRIKAYRRWLKMKVPLWAKLKIKPIDYNDIIYYAGPKRKPESLEEINPEI